MNIKDYSAQAISTDTFGGIPQPIDSHAFMTKILGLCGESGEVAEKIKKLLRDKNGIANQQDKDELVKELGDVLWYVNALSFYLGTTLENVAQKNLEKVLSRKTRGATNGSGDNR